MHINLSAGQLVTQVRTVTFTRFAASAAAVLVRRIRLISDASAEIDAHWFNVQLFALVALRRVTHSASNCIAVFAFTFKFAHANFFPLWNRDLQFVTVPTL